MGQRLVITIENNKKSLAKGYYHWSGYTRSGLITTNVAVAAFEKSLNRAMENITLLAITDKTLTPEIIKDKVELLTACYMLFATDAGMQMTGEKSEQDVFNEIFPNMNHSVGVNRNEGLVAITKEGMTDLQKWSEADVRINLDTKSVSVAGLFLGVDNNDDEEEEYENEEVMSIEGNLDEIPFEDLNQFVEKITTAINNKIYTFSNNGDMLGAIA
jgi:hypothetical protein